MTRKTNIKDVRTALKEAAVTATFGAREDRAGRFLPRQSSVIRDIHYDEDEATLDIAFTSGTTYRYQHVPVEVYVDFIEAVSRGAFFNDRIKGAFNYVEVTKHRSS